MMNEKKEISELLLIIEHRSLVESKKTIEDLLKLSKKGNLKQKCKLLGGTFRSEMLYYLANMDQFQ